MIIDHTNGFLDAVKTRAKEAGPQAEESLNTSLAYLSTYADGRVNAHLYKDAFAPNSFSIIMLAANSGEKWWNGGLIYSGPGLGGEPAVRLDGGAPAFTVSLVHAPVGAHHWSIHT